MTMRETSDETRSRDARPRAPARPRRAVCVFLFDRMLFASVGAYRNYTSYYRARTGWSLPRTRCPAGSRL